MRFEYYFFSCIETLQEANSRLQKRRKISVNFYFRSSQKSEAERQRKSIFMLFQTFLERIFSIHSYGENHRLKEIRTYVLRILQLTFHTISGIGNAK